MSNAHTLIIVGASGHALNVHFLAERLDVPIKGFLDDNPETWGNEILGSVVLGSIDSWIEHSECQFIVAVGSPRVRRRIVEQMERLGSPNYATLIDPAAVASGRKVTIGAGSVICAGAMLTTQISLGKHGVINRNATVGHDAQMGDYVTIAPLAAVSGHVTLADLVEVGTGACIRQGVTMAPGSMLGMGGVLTQNTDDNAVMVGNPARLLRHLPSI
ncbi:acetyltransferase [Duganella sp. FT94W]|uniref:Acetyltransferase n=1 Tax=Duganella lactea TaxID=2692173 RepID=A0ABW9V9V8_9BURK|nr:acetyltransferase [Duganella lactea]MYM36168.1 acetyltransferase [Duganella lactea]